MNLILSIKFCYFDLHRLVATSPAKSGDWPMLNISCDIYIMQAAENIVYVACRLKSFFLAPEVHNHS